MNNVLSEQHVVVCGGKKGVDAGVQKVNIFAQQRSPAPKKHIPQDCHAHAE
jgi:hypothetical protein